MVIESESNVPNVANQFNDFGVVRVGLLFLLTLCWKANAQNVDTHSAIGDVPFAIALLLLEVL